MADNVFAVSSRINSTWGGNLTDMVQARRYLEVLEADGLIERAAALGKRLVDDVRPVPGVENARGRGLFVAVDLPTTAARDAVVAHLHEVERVLILGCGDRSVRFRPALTVGEDELALAVAALGRAVHVTASAS